MAARRYQGNLDVIGIDISELRLLCQVYLLCPMARRVSVTGGLPCDLAGQSATIRLFRVFSG